MSYPKSLLKFYDLGLDASEVLQFTDLEWIPLNDIGGEQYWEWAHPTLTSIAFSGRRDEYSLFPDWSSADNPMIVFVGKESDGELLAPSFEKFLVRKCIEEFSFTWQIEHEDDIPEYDNRFRQYPTILKPIIGDDSSNDLLNLIADKQLTMSGVYGNPGYLNESEMKSAIKQYIGDDFWDKNIILDIENVEYNGAKRGT